MTHLLSILDTGAIWCKKSKEGMKEMKENVMPYLMICLLPSKITHCRVRCLKDQMSVSGVYLELYLRSYTSPAHRQSVTSTSTNDKSETRGKRSVSRVCVHTLVND